MDIWSRIFIFLNTPIVLPESIPLWSLLLLQICLFLLPLFMAFGNKTPDIESHLKIIDARFERLKNKGLIHAYDLESNDNLLSEKFKKENGYTENNKYNFHG